MDFISFLSMLHYSKIMPPYKFYWETTQLSDIDITPLNKKYRPINVEFEFKM